MKVSIIAAMDPNRVIGVNNQLPWHISADLKRFKSITIGSPVIMGRKTFESLDKKPLPGRWNYVVSRTASYAESIPPVSHAKSLGDVLNFLRSYAYEEVFVIGGGELYKEALLLADKLYLTFVDSVVDVKPAVKVAKFPPFDLEEWEPIHSERLSDHRFVIYTRS